MQPVRVGDNVWLQGVRHVGVKEQRVNAGVPREGVTIQDLRARPPTLLTERERPMAAAVRRLDPVSAITKAMRPNPGDTAGERAEKRARTANGSAPNAQPEPQQKRGVWCPSCGHAHRLGGSCPNLDLDLAKAEGQSANRLFAAQHPVAPPTKRIKKAADSVAAAIAHLGAR